MRAFNNSASRCVRPPRGRGQGTSSAPVLRQALDALPKTALELVRVLESIDAALALVAAYGGLSLRIPQLRGRDSGVAVLLLRVVSEDHVRRLARQYGGTDLYIPRCVEALRKARDVSIVEKFTACAAARSRCRMVRQLALEYGISERWVWKIIKDYKECSHVENLRGT